MQFRRLPTLGGTPRQIAEILNNTIDGKTNNTGTVTLRDQQRNVHHDLR
jgi:hypothetical protein